MTWEFVRALTDDQDAHGISAPDIGDDVLMTRVIGAWAAKRDVKNAEAEAAKRIRDVVRSLRDRGLSITDIAFLAHVSRGRVSQLLVRSGARREARVVPGTAAATRPALSATRAVEVTRACRPSTTRSWTPPGRVRRCVVSPTRHAAHAGCHRPLSVARQPPFMGPIVPPTGR